MAPEPSSLPSNVSLNPNRNPTLDRRAIERTLCTWIGAERVVWLPFGHSLDCGPEGTDGHIDGVMQGPDNDRLILEMSRDISNTEYQRQISNRHAIETALAALPASKTLVFFDPGANPAVSCLSHYLANDAVIVPIGEDKWDEPALDQLREIYVGRTVVGVPGKTIMAGGGGPHCITQQVPAGIRLR